MYLFNFFFEPVCFILVVQIISQLFKWCIHIHYSVNTFNKDVSPNCILSSVYLWSNWSAEWAGTNCHYRICWYTGSFWDSMTVGHVRKWVLIEWPDSSREQFQTVQSIWWTGSFAVSTIIVKHFSWGFKIPKNQLWRVMLWNHDQICHVVFHILSSLNLLVRYM